MSLPLVLRNGVLIPPDQAAISVFNPAIYGSYGVYESMQSVAGIVFEQASHIRRLFHSAAILELPMPADEATFARWIALAIEANSTPDCSVRLFVVGPDNGGEPTAHVWPQPTSTFPPGYYSHGASAILHEGQRTLPEAKSLNTLVCFLARRRAQAEGVHEGLLHHNGYLTEGSNSNLFIVMGDVLYTPPSVDVLSGVTRDLVLQLARSSGIPCRESKIAVRDIPLWDECFITSTSRHVMPITQIDEVAVGSGSVGPMTRRLMELFECYFRAWLERATTRSRVQE